MDDKEAFLRATGDCQLRLEESWHRNEPLSSEEYEQMEAVMAPLLLEGYNCMHHEVLTPQEYYQGCTAILLARLMKLSKNQNGMDRPSSVMDLLQDCLRSVIDSNDKENETPSSCFSFFSLMLEESQQHQGLALQDWWQVLGVVSTLQSAMEMGTRKRRQDENKWRFTADDTERKLRSLLGNRNHYQMTADSLDALWVVPMSYLVGYVVYHLCPTTMVTPDHEEESVSVLSWRTDIQPKIDDVLHAAFPRLRSMKYVEAGLLLLQLDLLQVAGTVKVVTSTSIAEDLMDEYVMIFFLYTVFVFVCCILCRNFLNLLLLNWYPFDYSIFP